ncbi:MAG: NYN domain-containing protein [Planctomycetales bacterium]|nr:NYN domain-containing protein [Planctomycetales bacterium]
MRLLIDGYNLLFQSPFLGRGGGAKWLENARLRLLTHLVERLPADMRALTTVVFDASRRTEFTQDFQVSDIQVYFAAEHPEADDLILFLLRQHSHAKQLTVVSGDRRIRDAARARKAVSVAPEDFLDWLDRQASVTTTEDGKEPSDKELQRHTEDALSDQEVQYWLDKFSDR